MAGLPSIVQRGDQVTLSGDGVSLEISTVTFKGATTTASAQALHVGPGQLVFSVPDVGSGGFTVVGTSASGEEVAELGRTIIR